MHCRWMVGFSAGCLAGWLAGTLGNWLGLLVGLAGFNGFATHVYALHDRLASAGQNLEHLAHRVGALAVATADNADQVTFANVSGHRVSVNG